MRWLWVAAMSARLLLPPDAPKEKWLAARRNGITASEIAVILGISPFDSAFNLYYKKIGAIPEDYDNTAMSLGRHLEPWIIDRFVEDHPEWYVAEGGLYVSDERLWQMATPDGLLWRQGELEAALEAKTAGSHDGWGEAGTDQIPAYYRAQVLWQLDTLGLPEAHVTCFFLATRQRRDYVVAYDETDVKFMRDAALDFLDQLRDREPPPIDHTAATTSALKALSPDVNEDVEIEIRRDLAEAYRCAKADLDDAQAGYDHLTNEIRAAMGDARHAVCDGRPVAVRSVYEVAEHVRKAHTVDKISPARAKKDPS